MRLSHPSAALSTLSTLSTLAALAVAAALAAPVPAAAESYGDGVSIAEPTPIADLLADPDAYLGKRVRVEGRVTEVCPMRGCWMELAEGEGGGSVVRIKVDDGVIVFPSDATGRPAAAEGVVEAIEMSRESYLGWLAHLAEERGESFDAAAAEVGEGPFRLIQVRATGAEIEPAPADGAVAEPAATASGADAGAGR